MSEDARSMELSAADYMTADGVEKLLEFIRKRLNIRDLDLETEAFDKYFNKMTRQRGETLHKYIHAEEMAYRKLQRILKEATEGAHDEFSGDEEDSPQKKFQLPKRLRGWLFMERSQIPLKERSGILNITQGLNIDRLKRVMTESFLDKVLKDIDGRSATKAPWQTSHRKKSHVTGSGLLPQRWQKNMMKKKMRKMKKTSMLLMMTTIMKMTGTPTKPMKSMMRK